MGKFSKGQKGGGTLKNLTLKKIAHIETGFETKFGIPRQSGLADVEALVVFEPEFADINALRGIEEFSHLWLIWEFSENQRDTWSPTVRPPRLGGNKKMGVFATRSPFRPNPIGLSSVKLKGVKKDEKGRLCLVVEGADLMNGTPIFDIKPYLSFTDCHTDAVGGFSDRVKDKKLEVEFVCETTDFDAVFLENVRELISEDPRPAYIENDERVYGFVFSGLEIKFVVDETKAKVIEIENSGRK